MKKSITFADVNKKQLKNNKIMDNNKEFNFTLVHVGDKVILEEFGRWAGFSYKVGEVTHVNKATFKVDNKPTLYYKKDGTIRGECYNHTRARRYSKEKVAEYEQILNNHKRRETALATIRKFVGEWYICQNADLDKVEKLAKTIDKLIYDK